MQVIRFMSANEALRFIGNRPLNNHNRHSEGNHSTSAGFCFWVDDSDKTSDAPALYNAAKHLSGLVTMDVALIGEVKYRRKRFNRTHGQYKDYGYKEELCTTQYSRDDFKDWRMFTPYKDTNSLGVVFNLPMSSLNWEQPVLALLSTTL